MVSFWLGDAYNRAVIRRRTVGLVKFTDNRLALRGTIAERSSNSPNSAIVRGTHKTRNPAGDGRVSCCQMVRNRAVFTRSIGLTYV